MKNTWKSFNEITEPGYYISGRSGIDNWDAKPTVYEIWLNPTGKCVMDTNGGFVEVNKYFSSEIMLLKIDPPNSEKT